MFVLVAIYLYVNLMTRLSVVNITISILHFEEDFYKYKQKRYLLKCCLHF